MKLVIYTSRFESPTRTFISTLEEEKLLVQAYFVEAGYDMSCFNRLEVNGVLALRGNVEITGQLSDVT